MANIVVVVRWAIVHGSNWWMAGNANDCAHLYFRTIQKVIPWLERLGEETAINFFNDALSQVRQAPTADEATWFLADILGTFINNLHNSSLYAPLFVNEMNIAHSLANAIIERVNASEHETPVDCAFGLIVQRHGNAWLAVKRDTKCVVDTPREISGVLFANRGDEARIGDISHVPVLAQYASADHRRRGRFRFEQLSWTQLLLVLNFALLCVLGFILLARRA